VRESNSNELLPGYCHFFEMVVADVIPCIPTNDIGCITNEVKNIISNIRTSFLTGRFNASFFFFLNKTSGFSELC
jgi:hypothetical protein